MFPIAAHGCGGYIPQVPTDEHEEEELKRVEKLLEADLEAKRESFFRTLGLSQDLHRT